MTPAERFQGDLIFAMTGMLRTIKPIDPSKPADAERTRITRELAARRAGSEAFRKTIADIRASGIDPALIFNETLHREMREVREIREFNDNPPPADDSRHAELTATRDLIARELPKAAALTAMRVAGPDGASVPLISRPAAEVLRISQAYDAIPAALATLANPRASMTDIDKATRDLRGELGAARGLGVYPQALLQAALKHPSIAANPDVARMVESYESHRRHLEDQEPAIPGLPREAGSRSASTTLAGGYLEYALGPIARGTGFPVRLTPFPEIKLHLAPGAPGVEPRSPTGPIRVEPLRRHGAIEPGSGFTLPAGFTVPPDLKLAELPVESAKDDPSAHLRATPNGQQRDGEGRTGVG